MSGVETNAVLQAFLGSVLDAWTQLLNDVLAGSCSVEAREEADPAFGQAAVRLSLKLEGALAGSAVVEMSAPDSAALTARLAQRSTDGAQVPGQSASVGGLLSQTVALAAKKLQNTYGRTLVTVGSGEEEPGWRPKQATSFTTKAPDCAPFTFRILLSEGIVSAAPQAHSAQPPEPAAGPNNDALQKANLDRILGVALELKLQFGRRTLPLRDLVELAAGSVIELDRRVQEPAGLLLGGKVIARGEVVLSEGNYALRVTEICDLQERLESV
jgi:flagellar motor switch protein FliN/FliY